MQTVRLHTRMDGVQAPIVAVVGDLIRQVPGTISLGQGVVHFPPPPAAVSIAREAAANPADEAARERDRVAAELERLNREYETRFGFRYCVFVAGRSRAALLPGFETALGQEREAELFRALDAVVDIARDRAHPSSAGPKSAVSASGTVSA